MRMIYEGLFQGLPTMKSPIMLGKNLACVRVVPMAEWVRMLIFSTLNHLSSHRCGFEPSPGHMRDKPSSACWWSGGFSRASPVFAPPYH